MIDKILHYLLQKPHFLPTRPDTRLPQLRAGGHWAVAVIEVTFHFGRTSEAKDRKNHKKVKCGKRNEARGLIFGI